ncbi:hypothetical protein N7452_007364 [Penicillium brevicompactum]|uniref:Uncharacterized protein n=1 Tax=Penicillium brevicompactum TaxID=5074 RepID=A0A9W9UDW9_PENBR|nr:hypothetical protein N7452_007364 [Penicillium brevicompactum]
MTCIEEHPNKPQLHLLAENGLNYCPRSLPAVVTLKVVNNPWCGDRAEPENFLNFITSCPNLKSCTWGQHTWTYWATLLEGDDMHKPFPSLEHLSLELYDLRNEMLTFGPHDRFDWSGLKSLKLGRNWEHVSRNLEILTGRMVNLKRLHVSTYSLEDTESDQSLEGFLMSFDTLEDLAIFNCYAPFKAIAHHPRLVNLDVHGDEDYDGSPICNMPEVQDLIHLDKSCPSLETIGLDIERVDDDWVCVNS